MATFLQGGAGRAITDLALAQRAAGRDVGVAATKTGVAGYQNYPEYVSRLRDTGIPVVLLDSTFDRNPAANLAAADSLTGLAPPSSLELVHTHAGTPARIGLTLASRSPRRVPVIQTMHGWGTNKTDRQAADDLETLNAVDLVIATSAASAGDMVQRGVDRSRLVTIPCGLPAALPSAAGDHPVIREGTERRAAGEFVLTCTGSVNANKNQCMLVHALPHVLRRHKVLCVFIGEGPDTSALERSSRALGVHDSVRLVGYQPEAARWLSIADLVVQPSLSEGQGLAVLEAFRAGVPAAASDIAAHRELITPGVNGWLFDPLRPDAVASAVGAALDSTADHRAQVIAAARHVFESRYTIEAMIAAHERAYASLSGRYPSTRRR